MYLKLATDMFKVLWRGEITPSLGAIMLPLPQHRRVGDILFLGRVPLASASASASA